jgi:hypothetical protein
VPRAICFNLYLVVAVLAGYGVLAITSAAARVGLARRVRAGLPIALALAVAVEIFTPSLALAGYAWPLQFVPRPFAPPRALVDLYRRLPEGAVLDLPFRLDARSRIRNMPLYVFLAGYHGRPVAGCANSFETPLHRRWPRWRRAFRTPTHPTSSTRSAFGASSCTAISSTRASAGSPRRSSPMRRARASSAKPTGRRCSRSRARTT